MKHADFKSQIVSFVCVSCAIVACLGATVERAHSATFLQTRRQIDQRIKSMPIMERPDRVGHLYGNTVRRVHRITNGRVNLDERLQN